MGSCSVAAACIALVTVSVCSQQRCSWDCNISVSGTMLKVCCYVCSVSEVAFIGSSLLEGCSGHNLAEAAVAGCAVLVGEHAGHFNTMADELNQAAVSLRLVSWGQGLLYGRCRSSFQAMSVLLFCGCASVVPSTRHPIEPSAVARTPICVLCMCVHLCTVPVRG